MRKSNKQYIYDICDKAYREGSAVLILDPKDDWIDILSAAMAECITRTSATEYTYSCLNHNGKIEITCQKRGHLKNDPEKLERPELSPDRPPQPVLDDLLLPPNHGKSGEPKELSPQEAAILKENLPPTQGWSQE